ncbi:L-threonylcarbamoyladenylate synthase [Desulfovibrio sp. OttesenSCG-928-C14]|nr:L-threonylcarbamoyladenylate synthase [Desulfovibrio sp. OttesenSCG-928-C14]
MLKFMEFEDAVRAARQGRPIVYPTETFYAVGASALSQDAARQVYAVKKRGHSYPLPVILGGLEQLELVAAPRRGESEAWELSLRLAELFWPGPLSLLLPAAPSLPQALTGGSGNVVARVPAHQAARELAAAAALPLISSSANISGRPPATRPEDLDGELLAALLEAGGEEAESKGSVLDLPPRPGGGLPSTIVRARPELGPRCLGILREGAVSAAALEEQGFICLLEV